MVNNKSKNKDHNSSNSLVFGRWPQTKMNRRPIERQIVKEHETSLKVQRVKKLDIILTNLKPSVTRKLE